MSKVFVQITMSLDGFVTRPNDSPELPLGEGGERLFDWYYSGDTPVPLPGTSMVFHVTRASADFLNATWPTMGAMVAGRRMFDHASAWEGHPPGAAPCFIVTHNPPQEWLGDDSPFTFVTDGVASAVRQAQEAAGGKAVSIASASIVKQCLQLGLLDEVQIHLAPVLMGSGVSLFDARGVAPVQLERTQVVAAPDVTHICYRVIK